MKKILIAGAAVLSLTAISAQQKEGRVIYQRVSQLQLRMAGMNEEMERMIPRSRTDKFELNFGNNQSVWKSADQDNDDIQTSAGEDGGGMQIRMVMAGSNDVVYTNFETGKRVELREMFDKKFIIDDSVRSLKWKMTGETKNILNHNCMKATATQISSRMQMTMDNGQMQRKEIPDTSNIVAWFATDIPVSGGPAEYQGQLPGLIMEMNVNDGRQVFTVLELTPKADIAGIKEPTGKKHVTPDEFRKEREKMMEEMQRNNPGGRRVMRMN